MALSHEHIGPKVSAKIKIYILSRAKLLCSLYPCFLHYGKFLGGQFLSFINILSLYYQNIWEVCASENNLFSAVLPTLSCRTHTSVCILTIITEELDNQKLSFTYLAKQTVFLCFIIQAH